jgi:hypothetical protein
MRTPVATTSQVSELSSELSALMDEPAGRAAASDHSLDSFQGLVIGIVTGSVLWIGVAAFLFALLRKSLPAF